MMRLIFSLVLFYFFSFTVYAGCDDQPSNEVDWTNCNFIENLDVLFDKWEPQPRFHLIKVDDSTILDNHNPNPISTTDEFKKEIAAI